MPLTTTLRLGDTVPAFALPDTDGTEHQVPLSDAPAATVLIVTCLHCPYVVAWNPRLRAAAEEYAPRGVRFLGIHSNDASRYPADSLEHMQRFVREHGWPYPHLHDESQDVARALGAEVTPHVFVLDAGAAPGLPRRARRRPPRPLAGRLLAARRARRGARRRGRRGARDDRARVQREVAGLVRRGGASGTVAGARRSS